MVMFYSFLYVYQSYSMIITGEWYVMYDYYSFYYGYN